MLTVTISKVLVGLWLATRIPVAACGFVAAYRVSEGQQGDRTLGRMILASCVLALAADLAVATALLSGVPT